MPSMPCCRLRAMWAFSEAGDMLLSRRFPVIERQWAILAGGSAKSACPLYDLDVLTGVRQALGADPLYGPQQPEANASKPSATLLWQLGPHSFVLLQGQVGQMDRGSSLTRPTAADSAEATESQEPPEQKQEDGDSARSQASSEDGTTQGLSGAGDEENHHGLKCMQWPLLVLQMAGALLVTMPMIPELLTRGLLQELAGSSRPGSLQGVWPDPWTAASTGLTAHFDLLQSLAGLLPTSSAASPPVGSKTRAREVEAALGPLRAFVGSSLAMGTYTGLLPVSGDSRGQVPQGGVAPTGLQPAWYPNLFAGKKQVWVVEDIMASLASTGHSEPAGAPGGVEPASEVRVHGRLDVAAQIRGLPEVSVPLVSTRSAMSDLAVQYCKSTDPPLAPAEPVMYVTVEVAPPAGRSTVARYGLGAEDLRQTAPPVTGSYVLQSVEGNPNAVAFSLELVYHPLNGAVVDLMTVELPMPSQTASLQSSGCSMGSLSVQDGRVTWEGLGGNRLSAKQCCASCYGQVTVPVAGASGSSSVSLWQAAVAGLVANVDFRLRGSTLSGVTVSKEKVFFSPSSQEVAVEVIEEVVAHKYRILSVHRARPAAAS